MALPAFDVPAVEASIAGTRFAGQVRYLESTGSTNQLALEAAQQGKREGVWVAGEQTTGRGRGGHTWHSPLGDGLYVSALIAPRMSSRLVLHLSLAAGLAAQHAIAAVTQLPVDLRWPNDLMMSGRKCGGVLVELATNPFSHVDRDTSLRFAVIGVGINLGHASFPPELDGQATSLRREVGRQFAPEPVLIEFLTALEDELSKLERETDVQIPAQAAAGGEKAPLLERFAAHSSWVHDKRVVVEGRYTGSTAGLTTEGFLQVLADDGELHVVRSGGVRSLSEEAPTASTQT